MGTLLVIAHFINQAFYSGAFDMSFFIERMTAACFFAQPFNIFLFSLILTSMCLFPEPTVVAVLLFQILQFVGEFLQLLLVFIEFFIAFFQKTGLLRNLSIIRRRGLTQFLVQRLCHALAGRLASVHVLSPSSHHLVGTGEGTRSFLGHTLQCVELGGQSVNLFLSGGKGFCTCTVWIIDKSLISLQFLDGFIESRYAGGSKFTVLSLLQYFGPFILDFLNRFILSYGIALCLQSILFQMFFGSGNIVTHRHGLYATTFVSLYQLLTCLDGGANFTLAVVRQVTTKDAGLACVRCVCLLFNQFVRTLQFIAIAGQTFLGRLRVVDQSLPVLLLLLQCRLRKRRSLVELLAHQQVLLFAALRGFLNGGSLAACVALCLDAVVLQVFFCIQYGF